MNWQALMPKNSGGSGVGSNNDQSSKSHGKKRGSKQITILQKVWALRSRLQEEGS